MSCRFCGAKNPKAIVINDDYGESYVYECNRKTCRAHGPHRKTQKAAQEAWEFGRSSPWARPLTNESQYNPWK